MGVRMAAKYLGSSNQSYLHAVLILSALFSKIDFSQSSELFLDLLS